MTISVALVEAGRSDATRRPASIVAAARCLALDAATVATVRVLSAAGIASVLLKGPAIAHRLYVDDPARRLYTDIDLLVAPARFAEAEQALAAAGYRPAIEGARPDDLPFWEHPWLVSGRGHLVVDLHRSFAGVGDADVLWSAVSGTGASLSLAGGLVRVPDATATALLLALHAASPNGSARPGADLVRGLAVLPTRDWQAAAGLARATRSEAAFSLGLRAVPAGAALAVSLDLHGSPTTAQWLDIHPASPAAAALAKLAAAPTAGLRLRLLGLRLFPSPGSMRYISPLARRGIAGLGLAYLGRVAHFALGAPRGLLELRDAEAAVLATAPVKVTHSRTRPVRATAHAIHDRDLGALRAGVWALVALHRLRKDLRQLPLDRITVRAAPAGGSTADRAVRAILRRRGASCLEGSLLRQRWYASQGVERELVIGVTPPGAAFHAHAWLAGETTAAQHDMVELLHRACPGARKV